MNSCVCFSSLLHVSIKCFVLSTGLNTALFKIIPLLYLQMVKKGRKLAKLSQREMNNNARKGEADRRILDSKPKHLFSGKRKMGKTDRR